MIKNIGQSFYRINKYIDRTPIKISSRLSEKYNCNIFLKREDLQKIRSFKIRGSMNKILKNKDLDSVVVCASAGNHAQGVAYCCNLLNLKGTLNISEKYCSEKKGLFIHPYDDIDIIEGQGTLAKEILDKVNNVDILLGCLGGGGMMSGVSSYFKNISPQTLIYGVEPKGAPSMTYAFKNGRPIELENIDAFVDGASISKVGDLTYDLCKKYLNDIFLVDNGRICNEMLELYQEDGIIVEPAGCLSICGLDELSSKTDLTGKNIVCIVSGGNNDIMRYPEILEKNQMFLGVKHYYIIEFSQRPLELSRFINKVLDDEDDITRFEYIKKTNKTFGNVLVGFETKDYLNLERKMTNNFFKFKKIDEDDLIYHYLV